jgi:NADH-quinone oxidoreductase subunit I
MSAYFNNVAVAITTILQGMWVTFLHLFQPNITIQYPAVKKDMFPLTRASLVNHVDECGYCLSCDRVCPVNIFTIKSARANEDEDLGILPDGKQKKMHIVHFEIDMSKCVYCGLCVDACDTKSLRWEQPQQECTFERPQMTSFWSDFDTQEERDAMLQREVDRKAAAAKARAEAAAAKKAKAKAKKAAEAAAKTDTGPDTE